MNCESANRQLFLHLYGELSFDEEEALEQHLEGCAACRGEMNALKALHRLADGAEVVPPAGLLESCRADLARRIGSEAPARRAGWWSRFWKWRPTELAWKPAVALALVALGFFAARLSSPELGGGPRLAGVSEPVASRVRYIEPEASGKVQIVLEETRQRVLSGRLDEAPIRQLLIEAAGDREDPGLRVESIDILKSQSASSEVHRTLLAALRNDPDSGVRLKALEGLKAFPLDAETSQAVSQTLLSDENPSVRALAVNLLVEGKQQDVVGVLQELLRKEKNDYIRERSARALREMRASVETF